MIRLVNTEQANWRGLGQDWRVVTRLKLLQNNRQRVSVFLLLGLVLLMSTLALTLSLALQHKAEQWQQALAGRLSVIIPPVIEISVDPLEQSVSYRLFDQDFALNDAALADALDRLSNKLQAIPTVVSVTWLSIDETRHLLSDGTMAEQDVWQTLGVPLLLEVEQQTDTTTAETFDNIQAVVRQANPNALIDDQGQWGEDIQRANHQLLLLLYGLNGFLIVILLLISIMTTRIDLWRMRDKLRVLWLLGATERVILILMMRRGLRIFWVGALCSLAMFSSLQVLLEIVFVQWSIQPSITLFGASLLGNASVWQGILLQYVLLIIASAVTNVLAARYYWQR